MKIEQRRDTRTVIALTASEFLVLLALSASTVGMIVYGIVNQ